MNPILYPASATEPHNLGEGSLADCISATVTQELNGVYELAIEYPITGVLSEKLTAGRRIYCRADGADTPLQMFVIYSVTRNLNGLIEVKARHISYLLSGVPVKPFTASGISNAVAALKTNSAVTNLFNFSCPDSSSGRSFTVSVPTSCRALMFDEHGIRDRYYGGDWYLSNYNCIYYRYGVGSDNGVRIVYKKNLLDLKQEISNEERITGIFPYYKSGNTYVAPSSPATISGAGLPNNVIAKDYTSQFNSTPTAAQLTDAATADLASEGLASESLNVSFIPLSNSGEFDIYSRMESVGLGDTVTVDWQLADEDGRLVANVSTKMRAQKYTFDVLREKYNNIEIGQLQKSLAKIIAGR